MLVDFRAVHCGGCRLQIPWYVEFNQEYRREGLRLAGIDMFGESPSVIRPFMETSHMTYPIAVGTDAIGQRFHVQAMPLTLLIDRQEPERRLPCRSGRYSFHRAKYRSIAWPETAPLTDGL